MIGKIYGTGSSLPKRIVKATIWRRSVDTNDAWIRERTGWRDGGSSGKRRRFPWQQKQHKKHWRKVGYCQKKSIPILGCLQSSSRSDPALHRM